MNVKAIIFGGIGTLAETSELQRRAFNDAFAEAGIPWHWDRDLYQNLLSTPGGQNRIREYAASRDDGSKLSDEQVASLHARKTELYREALGQAKLEPRAGVEQLIGEARSRGVKVAIASTTSEENISALLAAAGLDSRLFDVALHRGVVEAPKPDAAVYRQCLKLLGVAAAQAVALEDSDSGLAAALAAGLHCIALPGENTAFQDFSRASLVIGDSPAAGRDAGRADRRRFGLSLEACERLVAAIR